MITLGGLVWANYHFCAQNPGGVDFLAPWIRGRSFMMEGISPYTEIVDLRVQKAIYSRPAQGDEPRASGLYPLYSFFLFAPFSTISNYILARALWMTLLEISLIVIAFLALLLVEWRPRKWLLTVYLLFAALWYHGICAVVNGDAIIVVTLLLTGTLLAIKHKRDKMAGFLLAYATIEPKSTLLLILLIMFWSISQRRWKIVGWFVGGLVALIVTGMIFIPNWIIQNIWTILRYPSYTQVGTLSNVLSGWMPGIVLYLKWGIPLVFGSVLLWEWWAARDKNFEWFLWTASLTLVISQWIGIQTDPGNFVFIFFALVLVLSGWDKRWKRFGKWIDLTILSILLVGLWSLFILTLDQTYQLTQDSIMFIPLPAFLLIGLYWVKWWIVRPARLALEQDL